MTSLLTLPQGIKEMELLFMHAPAQCVQKY